MTSFLNTSSNVSSNGIATFFGLFTPTTAGPCTVVFWDSSLTNNTASPIGFGSIISFRITQTYDSNVASFQHLIESAPTGEESDDEDMEILEKVSKVKRIAGRYL
jgi:hypothetical protein